MRWPSVAITATVLAAAIRIDAVTKADVGAVVFGNNALGVIGQVFGRPMEHLLQVGFILNLLKVRLRPAKAVRWIQLRTTPFGGRSLPVCHNTCTLELGQRIVYTFPHTPSKPVGRLASQRSLEDDPATRRCRVEVEWAGIFNLGVMP